MKILWKILELFVKIVSLNQKVLHIKRFFNSFVIFVALTLTVGFLGSLLCLINLDDDLSIEQRMRSTLILQILTLVIGHVVFKGIYLFMNCDEFYDLLNWMKNFEHREFDDLLRDYGKKYTRMTTEWSQKLLRFMFAFYTFGASSFTVEILFFTKVVIVPFIPTSNLFGNGIAIFLQIVISTVAMCAMVFFDILPILTGLHIVCMTFIIRDSIKKLRIARAPTEADEEASILGRSKLLKVIQLLHCELLIKLDAFCNTFSMLALIQLINSFLLLLFILFTTNELTSTLTLKASFFGAMMEILLICLLGQIVSMQPEDIYDDFCQTNWYEMSIVDQKHFLFLPANGSEELRPKGRRNLQH
uniref:Odorant receptor n=1 Tax=Lutzomyia longipalpis TaxID=7200 RepID=A0A3F2ZDE8_LUTLO